MPVISVIVPVYNTASYLERCIKSIVTQSLQDIEIILVDDGSTDESGHICDKWVTMDKRVRSIHQKNSGASSARNRGMEEATGEYIAFCDSDDIVDTKWLEHFWKTAKEFPSYQARCGYVDNDINQLGRKEIETGITTNRFAGYGFIWNGLFERKIIEVNHIRFRVLTKGHDYNEDLLFSCQYLKHTNGTAQTGYADYCYCHREGSLSTEVKLRDVNFVYKYIEKYELVKDLYGLEDSGNIIQEKADEALYYTFQYLSQGVTFPPRKEYLQCITSERVRRMSIDASGKRENSELVDALRKSRQWRLWSRMMLHKCKRQLSNKYRLIFYQNNRK